MWLFLPDAFYSIRSYDPTKGGILVDQPHIVVRARVERDIDKVRKVIPDAVDLAEGSDYRYHLAVPTHKWVRFLESQTCGLRTQFSMKQRESDRISVHTRVWNATWDLNKLDG